MARAKKNGRRLMSAKETAERKKKINFILDEYPDAIYRLPVHSSQSLFRTFPYTNVKVVDVAAINYRQSEWHRSDDVIVKIERVQVCYKPTKRDWETEEMFQRRRNEKPQQVKWTNFVGRECFVYHSKTYSDGPYEYVNIKDLETPIALDDETFIEVQYETWKQERLDQRLNDLRSGGSAKKIVTVKKQIEQLVEALNPARSDNGGAVFSSIADKVGEKGLEIALTHDEWKALWNLVKHQIRA